MTPGTENNMYWQDQPKPDQRPSNPDGMTDVAFQIACQHLPVDHAWALYDALRPCLPWLEHERGAGVHPIHVADSGNGWMRPDAPGELLQLSRRTRLVLRLPGSRLEESERLVGLTLDVAGHRLQVEKRAALRPLRPHPALFSRYLVAEEAQDESTFLAIMHKELVSLGIRPRKMLCGIEKTIRLPEKPVRTRSLMVADLAPDEAMHLQHHGLGTLRHLGCGLFLPHKDIQQVGQPLD